MPRRRRAKRAADTPPEGAHEATSRWVFFVGWIGLALLLTGLLAYYLARSKRLAGEFGLPLDDGWIHARFAQNLARGYGFSFNPGEPTSTTTGPLWTLLLSLGYRLSGEHLFTGIAINFVLCVLLCLVVYRLALALGQGEGLALAAALVVACTVPLAWWTLSGMEPPLYAVLALLGILLHISLRRASGLRALWPTLVFAMAGVARPEMLVLFPLAMLDRLVMSLLEKRERPLARWARDLVVHLPVFVLLVAPMFAYNHRTTGYLLPTSYYSKLQRVGVPGALADPSVMWSQALIVGPATELWQVWVTWAHNNCLLIAPFFIGLGWLVWRARSPEAGRNSSLLIPMLVFAQPLLWALVAGYRPPDYQSQRYLADLNPLFILLGMIGGCWLTERLGSLRRPSARAVLVGLVILVSLLRQPSSAEVYGKNVRDTTQMQVTIGRWVRDNVPPGSLLAVNDIGAIGFITNMPVLDLQGLVTPEILWRRDMARRVEGTAPKLVFEFIADHEPDYLIIFPEWYWDLDMRRDLFTLVFQVYLEDNVTNGAALMRVYRTVWATDSAPEHEPTP
jgi:hypothetical protein